MLNIRVMKTDISLPDTGILSLHFCTKSSYNFTSRLFVHVFNRIVVISILITQIFEGNIISLSSVVTCCFFAESMHQRIMQYKSNNNNKIMLLICLTRTIKADYFQPRKRYKKIIWYANNILYEEINFRRNEII